MSTLIQRKALTGRASGNLTAQNATIVLGVGGDTSQVASVVTSEDAAADADFVIEAEMIETEWTSVGLFDAKAQAAADSVTGPSQYGWTDVPGALSVRVRRTDANGGNGTVTLILVEA